MMRKSKTNLKIRASRVFSRSENVSRDILAHKKIFLDTSTLRVDTRNARFLKSLITFISTLIFLFSSYITARRDPFTCPLKQQPKKELSTPLPLKTDKKSDEKTQTEWQVQEMRKDTVVLKDAQGNIREISFAETQK